MITDRHGEIKEALRLPHTAAGWQTAKTVHKRYPQSPVALGGLQGEGLHDHRPARHAIPPAPAARKRRGGARNRVAARMGGMRLPYSRHTKRIESYSEHQTIVAAIAARDGEAAVAALKRNIRQRRRDRRAPPGTEYEHVAARVPAGAGRGAGFIGNSSHRGRPEAGGRDAPHPETGSPSRAAFDSRRDPASAWPPRGPAP
ncbi:MAG: FCD domain-containing protein, partial [Verrucomicrobia bacterium]|nr:FCD domain-containing protein [Verrucomicrobiota bacterium]